MAYKPIYDVEFDIVLGEDGVTLETVLEQIFAPKLMLIDYHTRNEHPTFRVRGTKSQLLTFMRWYGENDHGEIDEDIWVEWNDMGSITNVA